MYQPKGIRQGRNQISTGPNPIIQKLQLEQSEVDHDSKESSSASYQKRIEARRPNSLLNFEFRIRSPGLNSRSAPESASTIAELQAFLNSVDSLPLLDSS